MENDSDQHYCTLVASSINLSAKLVIHFESTLRKLINFFPPRNLQKYIFFFSDYMVFYRVYKVFCKE